MPYLQEVNITLGAEGEPWALGYALCQDVQVFGQTETRTHRGWMKPAQLSKEARAAVGVLFAEAAGQTGAQAMDV